MDTKNKKYIEDNSIGQIFTPEPIAKFIVKNSLRFISNSNNNVTKHESEAGI